MQHNGLWLLFSLFALSCCPSMGSVRGSCIGEIVNEEPTWPCFFSWYLRVVARTLFAVANNIYCVPAYVVWMMILRLVRPVFAPLYWKAERLMFHWLLAMVSMWSWTAGFEIYESGEDPVMCGTQRTLVIVNHQSTADVPMLMAAWNPRPGVLPNLMWIMDRVFKYTNFGVVSLLHKDFFIQAGRESRDASLDELRNHIRSWFIPLGRQWMVLFPEGGFLHKRKAVSLRFAEKNNLPKLEYVTIPRAGAMRVIMEELIPNMDQEASCSKDADTREEAAKNHAPLIIDTNCGDNIEWILDVTIAYPDRIPLHLTDIVCGIRPPCRTQIHYRLYRSTEVPSDVEGMTNWLYERFFEKNNMLEEFYKTGHFPTKETRKVRQDPVRYIFVHTFFLLSTYVQYSMWRSLVEYIW